MTKFVSLVLSLGFVVTFGLGAFAEGWDWDAPAKKEEPDGKKVLCEVWVYVTDSEVRLRHIAGSACDCGVEHHERHIVFSTQPGIKTNFSGAERQPVTSGWTVKRPPETRVIRHYYEGRGKKDVGGRPVKAPVYIRYHQTYLDGKWEPPLPADVDAALQRYHRGRGESGDPPARRKVRRPDTVVFLGGG